MEADTLNSYLNEDFTAFDSSSHLDDLISNISTEEINNWFLTQDPSTSSIERGLSLYEPQLLSSFDQPIELPDLRAIQLDLNNNNNVLLPIKPDPDAPKVVPAKSDEKKRKTLAGKNCKIYSSLFVFAL